MEQSTGSTFQFSVNCPVNAFILPGQCIAMLAGWSTMVIFCLNLRPECCQISAAVIVSDFVSKVEELSPTSLSRILCQTLSSESKSNRAFLTAALQNQKLGSTGGCTGVKKTENSGWCRTLFVVSHQLASVPCSNARHVLALVSSAAINYR